jgi:hypothetical protein
MAERKRALKWLFWLGIVLLLTPLGMTVLGILYCAVQFTQICVAVGFAWIIYWWISAIGLVCVIVSQVMLGKRRNGGAP